MPRQQSIASTEARVTWRDPWKSKFYADDGQERPLPRLNRAGFSARVKEGIMPPVHISLRSRIARIAIVAAVALAAGGARA